ncbi:DsbA family protein [Enemella evansiae]|uniref:Thioredoxin n=1 Tax=Enemella evansiae TaxID=2016499 RepID=A0A255G5H7_9ACTN|nr:thioredoxin domain-containing protein [Enemella evansiae]PFG67321.1 protein-disulfide isomerase [Propionibacteriaceae bacterium ES.041]OYN98384.1 thioredoxin [Enemella evansiae]OYN99140.1 thioredoxin [Enemella evansiae]OYO05230.1 thioredoxin [Enemella evansiae]OYO10722.1 thioredoxin [Enemella evansiae]
MPNKPPLPRNARRRAAAIEAERKRKAAIRRNVIISGSVLALAAIVIGIVVAVGNTVKDRQAEAAGPAQLVRDNSVYLNRPADAKVTVVEFLDFECEACGALYPTMEKARETYGDRVNFVVRYFPIESHFNAMRSARAVEAAGQQGKWEPMYQKMYETQTQWAEQRVPQDEVFRGFAQELGLDMAAWDAAYKDPATEARIKADQADGTALGVQGTPTVFVNGQQLQLRSSADLTGAIDKALAGG